MWKTIEFEPNYEVSVFGEVRSKITGHVKSLRLNRQGYSRVTLYPIGKTYTIHRLVALTFLKESFKEGLVVNHKNGVKTDNNVDNLEWVTCRENTIHAEVTGLYVRPDFKGLNNPMSKFSKEDLDLIIKLSRGGATTSQIAKQLGCPYERVRRFLTGQHYN